MSEESAEASIKKYLQRIGKLDENGNLKERPRKLKEVPLAKSTEVVTKPAGCSSCAAKIAAKVAKAIVNHDASKELINERLNICDGCPFKTSILGLDQCGKCSCLISLKTKLKDEVCPAGKW